MVRLGIATGLMMFAMGEAWAHSQFGPLLPQLDIDVYRSGSFDKYDTELGKVGTEMAIQLAVTEWNEVFRQAGTAQRMRFAGKTSNMYKRGIVLGFNTYISNIYQYAFHDAQGGESKYIAMGLSADMNNVAGMAQVIFHEIGHTLGLSHTGNSQHAMYGGFRPGKSAELSCNEVSAIAYFYGGQANCSGSNSWNVGDDGFNPGPTPEPEPSDLVSNFDVKRTSYKVKETMVVTVDTDAPNGSYVIYEIKVPKKKNGHKKPKYKSVQVQNKRAILQLKAQKGYANGTLLIEAEVRDGKNRKKSRLLGGVGGGQEGVLSITVTK